MSDVKYVFVQSMFSPRVTPLLSASYANFFKLPIEQGWISHTSLISNYDQDRHTDDHYCRALPSPSGWPNKCVMV